MEGSVFEDISVLSQTHATTYMSADVINEKIGSSFSQFYFPVFDELSRAFPPNKYITPLILLIMLIQTFVIGYAPLGKDIWNFDNSTGRIIKYLSCTIDFFATSSTYAVPQASTAIVINCAIIVIWIFNLLYYKVEKTFLKYSLHVLRIAISYINYIFLIPTFTIFGVCFNNCFKENNILSISFTLILFFLSIAIMFLFYIETTLRSGTVYFENTVFAQYLNTDVFLFFSFNAVFSFCIRFVYSMPIWALHVLILFFIFAESFIVFRFFFVPFKSHIVNSLIPSIAITQIIALLLVVLPNVNSEVKFYVPVGVFLIFTPIIYFIQYLIRKRENGSNVSSELRAKRTIRIIFSEHPEKFVKWELIKRIWYQHQTPFIFAEITRTISFFPGESYQLNSFLSAGSKFTNLTIYELFVYYQARKVYLLRQSTNTKMVVFEMEQIKRNILTLAVSIRSLLLRLVNDRQSFSIDILMGIASMRQSIKSDCRELLDKYPNNPAVAREYSRFLVECCSQFDKGLRWFTLATAIEQGRRESGDQCFKTMVNSFPVYLRRGIIDVNGARKGQKNGLEMQSRKNRTSSSQNSTSMESFELNLDQADKLFDHPRLRFAFKNAVKNMKSRPFNWHVAIAWIIFVGIVFFFMGFYIFSMNSMQIAEQRKDISQIVASFLDHLNLAYIAFIENWVHEASFVQSDNYEEVFGIDNFTMDSQFLKENAYMAMKDYIVLTQFLGGYDDVIWQNAKDEIYIFDESNPRYTFLQNETLVITNSSASVTIMKTIGQLFQTTTINFSDVNQWKSSVEVCEVSLNFQFIIKYFNRFCENFIGKQNTYTKKLSKELMIFASVIIPVIFLLILIPIIIVQNNILKDSNRFFKIFGLSSNDTLKEAAKPICIPESELNGVSWRLESKRASRLINHLIVAFFAILFSFWIALIVYFNYQFHLSSKNQNVWISYASRRHPAAINMLAAVYFSVFGLNYPNIEWIYSDAVYQINDTISTLLELHNYLLVGSEDAPSCSGAHHGLDELHFSWTCDVNDTEYNIHSMYRCMSLDQMIVFYAQLGSEISRLLTTSNGTYDINDTDIFFNIRHIALYHAMPNLSKSVGYTLQLWDTNMSYFSDIFTVLFVISILFALIFHAFNLYWHHQISSAFSVFKSFVARLPPSSIVENTPLLNLITSKQNAIIIKSSLPKSVVTLSPTPIMLYDQEGIIEYLNDSAIQTLGFTREQLIGQHISTVFNSVDLTSQISPDSENQSIIKHSIAFNGETQGEPLRLEITRIIDQTNVLIIQDVTQIEKYNNDVIRISNNVKSIYYSIVPPSSAKTSYSDITTSEFIAAIRINVVKFTDYSSSLAPANVLKNLEAIMKFFEDARKNHPMITKLDISGSDYLCAVGLFADEGTSKEDIAVDAATFATECMHGIEEINHSIESSLQLRICIVCGGPVFYCLLSQRPPIFSAIGRPITMSRKLMEMTKQGTLVVCEDVAKFLPKEFNVTADGNKLIDGKMVFSVKIEVENIL